MRLTVPLGAVSICLHAGDSGVVTVRPQLPVRVRRPIVMVAPWTQAIQDLDVIISDARAWGVTNARVLVPASGEIPLSETSVIAALMAERNSLVRWSPVGATPDGWVPTGIDLERLVAGNLDHLISPVSLDFVLTAGGSLNPVPVDTAQDFAAHVRNTSAVDREIMFTWLCDRES